MSGPLGSPDPDDARRVRLRRLVDFTRQLAASLRDEFGYALASPPADASPAARGDLAALNEQLTRLTALLASVERGLAGSRPVRGEIDDAGPVVAATRGLQARADLLRADPAIQRVLGRPVPPPAGARPAEPARSVTGRLSKWLRKLEVLAMDEPPEAPAPAPLDPAIERARQAFEATVGLAAQIMAYVTPRLTLIKAVTTTLRLPGQPPGWVTILRGMPAAAEALGVPASLNDWLVPLAKLFMSDGGAARDAQVAVQQWEQARPRLEAAQLKQLAMAAAEPGELVILVAEADTAPLRLAMLPLNHLHLTFKGRPVLCELFPPPRV